MCDERSEFSFAIRCLQKLVKVVERAWVATVGLEGARVAMVKVITPDQAPADERWRSVVKGAALSLGLVLAGL